MAELKLMKVMVGKELLLAKGAYHLVVAGEEAEKHGAHDRQEDDDEEYH